MVVRRFLTGLCRHFISKIQMRQYREDHAKIKKKMRHAAWLRHAAALGWGRRRWSLPTRVVAKWTGRLRPLYIRRGFGGATALRPVYHRPPTPFVLALVPASCFVPPRHKLSGGFFSSTPFRQGFHERARPASEAARGLPSKKKNVPHGRTFSARKIDFTFS